MCSYEFLRLFGKHRGVDAQIRASEGSWRAKAAVNTAGPTLPPRGGDLIAVNTAEQVEPTTNYHLEETEKLHVHTWQWHLTGVSLPATAPRTAWHLRCEKYSTCRAPHKQITGGELLQNDFKMSVNYM